MTESWHIVLIEKYKGFDIEKVKYGITLYFKVDGGDGGYSSPQVCKRVIDTYLKRTGQWEKGTEAKVITIGRPAAEYSNKKHG